MKASPPLRRPVRKPLPGAHFNRDREVAALAEVFDRVAAGHGEAWERPVAAYALIDLVLDMIAALDDPELGPRLDPDAYRIEPGKHLPVYLKLYAEAWLDRARRTRDGGWWEVRRVSPVADSDIAENEAGEWRTYVTLVPDEEASRTLRRIAWRIWQARVRSGDVLGEREWYDGLAAFLADYEEEFRELTKPG